jgi:prepilin-type N-terminal cleavage/methylation domain-containing protein/prepilin-type processing-associated H-X9-DG protein
MRSPPVQEGFTLVELLVVIAIIGVLVALLLPAVQAAREAARRSQCQNNLKQISLASVIYHDSYKILPYSPSADNRNQANAQRRSWVIAILPFIEETAIYDRMDMDIQGNQGINLELIRENLSGVLCPSDDEAMIPAVTELSLAGWTGTGDQEVALISYAANSGDHRNRTGVGAATPPYMYWANDAYDANSTRGVISRFAWSASYREIADGTSHTFLYGEIVPSWCYWHAWGLQSWSTTAHQLNAYNDLVRDSDGWMPDECITFRSLHSGGAYFSYCDGSVQFVSDGISGIAYRAAASRQGGEIPDTE